MKVRVPRLFKSVPVRCALWVALCFFLTSAVYLSWFYHLLELTDGFAADLISMGAGYLCQAVGLGLVVWRRDRVPFTGASVLLAVAAVPALVSGSLAGTVIFGLLVNILCGVIAGHYLHALAARVESGRRGLVFGAGYGLSTIAVWLFSLPGQGSFLRSRYALPVYLALIAGMALLTARLRLPDLQEGPDKPRSLSRKDLILACAAVGLLSLVKNMGFSFPSADIAAGLHVELSRVFYALGLVAAGVVTDKSRKHGALCTRAALAIPFIMLAVRDEPVSAFVSWSLDYLFYGFFSVFRAVLFADMAARARRCELAPLGLLLGRVGDAAGTGLCVALGEHKVALVAATFILFLTAVFLFFRLFQTVYEPEAVRQRSEREVFEDFAIQHDLSAREREVLRLALAERSNAEIAQTLFVSESTIKYHMHNLLKKTGCKSRVDLMARYAAALYPRLEK